MSHSVIVTDDIAPDIIGKVFDLMASEDSPSHSYNRRIKTAYEESSVVTQIVIDDIFISLCGYSLKTILQRGSDD